MIGIVAEGRADQAVITNILKGELKTDKGFPVSPLDFYDNTDLALKDKGKDYSNWEIVKNVCINKDLINRFHATEGNENLIIQIDTDVCEHSNFGIKKPKKDNDYNQYTIDLRNLVIEKIKEWLKKNNSHETTLPNIYFAVTIEQTDAWVLTLYSDKKETAQVSNPKAYFEEKILPKHDKLQKEITDLLAFAKYKILSTDFKKPKKLNKARQKNKSLDLFVESIEDMQNF